MKSLELHPTEDMARITWPVLCRNMDMILDRILDENIGYVIQDDSGHDSLVVCPARWIGSPEDKYEG